MYFFQIYFVLKGSHGIKKLFTLNCIVANFFPKMLDAGKLTNLAFISSLKPLPTSNGCTNEIEKQRLQPVLIIPKVKF